MSIHPGEKPPIVVGVQCDYPNEYGGFNILITQSQSQASTKQLTLHFTQHNQQPIHYENRYSIFFNGKN